MEINKTSARIHPLIAGAAVSVILVSLVGVAAMTGFLPTSHSTGAASAALSSPVAQIDNDGLSNESTKAQPLSSPAIQFPPHGAPAAPSPVQQSRSAMQYQESQALAQAPAVQQAQGAVQYQEPRPVTQAPAVCKNCGKVQSVRIVQHQAKPSGVGVVAGAVLGGVLGNQVGGGNGRSLATVAGAVGGGYAGNEIEKRSHTTTSYQVQVRMEDGHIRHFTYAAQPGWHAGDRVRVVNGHLTSRA